jgi:hypothetical protein
MEKPTKQGYVRRPAPWQKPRSEDIGKVPPPPPEADNAKKGGSSEKIKLSDLGSLLIVLVILFGVPGLLLWIISPNSIRYPVLYGLMYHVSMSHVSVDKQPADCEWEHAPLGEKGCHYAKEVTPSRNGTGQVTEVYVTWYKVQD